MFIVDAVYAEVDQAELDGYLSSLEAGSMRVSELFSLMFKHEEFSDSVREHFRDIRDDIDRLVALASFPVFPRLRCPLVSTTKMAAKKQRNPWQAKGLLSVDKGLGQARRTGLEPATTGSTVY